MKKRDRRRRNARHAAPFAVALLLAALGAGTHATRADDVTHPLVPSRYGNAPDLQYEDGVPGSAERPVVATHAQLVAEGAALYSTHCTTCHGADLRGSPGVPSLLRAGGAAVDFYMSTGRMPAAVPGVQEVHLSPSFDNRQTAAIDAYVSSRARSSIPVPNVVLDPAKLQRGRYLFEENCEMCHGAAAQGAIVGYGWIALNLKLASPTQIGEAIRIGPGVMPRFTPALVSDDDVDAIATYVRYIVTEPGTYGGLTFNYLGVVIEGALAIFFGVFALFWVIFFTGTKTTGVRLHED